MADGEGERPGGPHALQLAKLLLDARVPLRLFGRGWDAIEPVASAFAGPLTSRETFAEALSSIRAIVNVWPVRWRHPCEFAGLPVVPRAKNRDELLRSARAALSGKVTAPTPPGPALSLMSLASHAR